MNSGGNKEHILAQIAAIKQLLDSASVDSELVRWGFEDRIAELKQQLAALDSAAPNQPVRRATVIITHGAVVGDRGAKAEVAGAALVNYARLLKARSAQRVKWTPRPRKRRNQPRAPMARSYEPYVVDVVHGSFGFVLEDLSPESGGRVDFEVIDDVSKILRLSSGSEDEFDEVYSELNKFGRSALKDLVSTLADSVSGLRVTEAGETEEIGAPSFLTLNDRLRGVKANDDVMTFRGVIRGLVRGQVRQRGRYEFISSESMALEASAAIGPVDRGLSEEEITLIQDVRHAPVDAHFRRSVVERVGRAPQTTFTLIGVTRVSDHRRIGRAGDSDDEVPADESEDDPESDLDDPDKTS